MLLKLTVKYQLQDKFTKKSIFCNSLNKKCLITTKSHEKNISLNISFLGYAPRTSNHGPGLHPTTGEGKYWSQFIFNVYCIQL